MLLCCGFLSRGWTHYFFMLLILGHYGPLRIGSRSSPLVLLNGPCALILLKISKTLNQNQVVRRLVRWRIMFSSHNQNCSVVMFPLLTLCWKNISLYGNMTTLPTILPYDTCHFNLLLHFFTLLVLSVEHLLIRCLSREIHYLFFY